MKLWSYVEQHHEELGVCWFVVPILMGMAAIELILVLAQVLGR